MKIGEQVKLYRKARKLSIRKLGEISGVNFPDICRIENGGDCKLSTICKLARALDVKLYIEKEKEERNV